MPISVCRKGRQFWPSHVLLPEGEEHEQLAAHREIPKQQKASWPNSLDIRHMVDGGSRIGNVTRCCRWSVVGIPLLRLESRQPRDRIPAQPRKVWISPDQRITGDYE